MSWVLVWWVFHDPSIDYRLVMAGALLPDLVDAAWGGTRYAHTLLASVALLATVMVSTRHSRRRRRQLLAVPIGTLLHLLLDGMWSRTRVFWWPLSGTSFGSAGLPSFSRPALLVGLQELAGAVALAWCWQRFELGAPIRRARFLHTGRLGTPR